MMPRFIECLIAFVLGLTLAAVCRAETVYIDEAAFYSDRLEVLYRVNDGPQVIASTPLAGDVHLQLPQTSVEILCSWADEWEWIVRSEPTVKVIWK
jgi:thymidine kinase